MSLRAIKKRESQSQKSYQNRAPVTRKSLNVPRKPCSNPYQGSEPTFIKKTTLSSVHSLEKQRKLLGRRTRSTPELRKLSDTLELLSAHNGRLVRTKSETDVNVVLETFTSYDENNLGHKLASAKSEVSLQTISVHNTFGFATTRLHNSPHLPQSTTIVHQSKTHKQMLSGARSHRDLSQSSYSGQNVGNESTIVQQLPMQRRMSECSYNSVYSQRTSGLSGSALTLSHDGSTTDTAVRVPIIGYEVMEERARFTVYKLRVENPYTNDCWLVLRRYTDFVRLNTKLKQAFPNITLMLPRKKIFGDNFNAVFLDNRVQGLQMFVNSIMAKQELRKCKIVREFFCLDEPPTYSESMEECRAIFEAQEETIAHLKLQINNKNEAILNLQQKLREEMTEKEQLKQILKNGTSKQCSSCSSITNSITHK